MEENLLSAIKAHDFTAIHNICFALSEEERQELKSYFARKNFNFIFREVLEKEKRYHFSNKELAIISYTIMCVCNTLEEVRKIETFQNIEPYIKGNYYYFLSSLEDEVLLDFVQSPQGAYMIEGIQLMYKDNPLEMSFQILWSVYKAGYIPLNEGVFIQRMYDLNWFKADEHLTKYLLKHPEAVVLFPSVPAYIQDTIFTTEEWKKIYHTLNKKGYFTNKNAILHAFIEALLNPWKKTVLDMYCRWIETLEPSLQELLANQHTLFALLSSDKTSVINFAIKLIKQIANEKAFDFQAFADNFALCFTTQKIAKSQLIGVEILEKHYKKQAPTNPDYREQLAVLFTVPDAKLQEKAASLLKTYFGGEGLVEVVVPYQDYLKGKALELFSTLSPAPILNDNLSCQLTDCSPSEKSVRVGYVTELETPTTPEALLFLLGDCLRERTPQTIDLFFEGFNQLQDDFPADFKEQLAPYLKQLERHWNGIASVPILRWFLQRWTGDKKKLSKEDEEFFLTTLPYLYYKAQHLLENRKKKNRLPLLSTPTHAPFYIEVEVLMDRLLQYEAQSENPELHDLVVACNRLLFKDISAVAKEKAQKLKGAYAPAIQYYIGLTDKVQPTEELLPLWTQITRIKYPDGEFVEFANTSAKDIPCVVKPFETGFGVLTRKQSTVTFHYLSIHDNWNNNFDARKKPTEYPVLYYNAGNSRKGWSTDILYQCSLNPHYPEAQILRYIASYAKGNESYDIEYMQTSMQVLLENHLPIYHSGWLFVAAALLFEKKPTRDMAAAYILECLESGTNLNLLAQYIGKLLAEQYAPIARFVEFLDIPTHDPKVKAFQKSVVEAYLPLAEKLDKKPTNHKKLATFIN